MSHLIIPLFISNAGCPNSCIFCDQRKTARSREAPEDIEDQIATWLARKAPSTSRVELAFYGGSFTGLPVKRQEEFLKEAERFIKSGDIQAIRISTRPDRITAENLVMLKGYNVATVELGVQSMDSEVLESSKRGYAPGDVREAFALLKELGFQTGAQLMPGLPGDTPEKNRETARRVVLLRPDFARIYPLLIIRGTPLEELYRRGLYTPLSLESAVEWSCHMYSVLKGSGVEVIRTGLQATDLLDSGDVIVSGPYHPAFGQLVKSRLALRGMRELLSKLDTLPREEVVVYVTPGEVSNFVGQRRENILKLKEEINRELLIRPSDELGAGEFAVEGLTGTLC